MRFPHLFAPALLLAAVASAQTAPEGLIYVAGGPFKNTKSNYYGKSQTTAPYVGKTVAVHPFYIGKYEVTQKEWTAVMGDNPSKFRGDNLPVDSVTWYDCIVYCNQRSVKEGLKPFYNIDKNRKDPNNTVEIDDVKWTVTTNFGANGYRLPTEMEWEYAASGGQQSKNFTYSGGDDINKIAWYWANAGDHFLTGFWAWPRVEQNHNKTKPVGSLAPNELGIYDMSGNVREWCWNWYGDAASTDAQPQGSSSGRVWRGGGWLGGDFCCASAFRASYEASGKAPDQGLRVCRDL